MSEMNSTNDTSAGGASATHGHDAPASAGAAAAPEFNFAGDAGVAPDISLQAGEQADLHAQIEQLKAELAVAQALASNNHDLHLRAVAEVDNIRRRSADEVSKAHKFAIESFAEALIPAKDSLEMALTIPNQTLESLREGVEATLRQLRTGFEKGRLQEINPVGEKFDPHRHQAVSMVPGNSVEPPVPSNHVVAVLQKGYLIADRVLRPALVAVAQ